ncbi:MAG: asparagine synthase (glutamine-hydrolyzing) [Bacteroidales bacterium]
MCGIVALLCVGTDIEPAALDRMRDRLAHRGPDGAGSWITATPAGAVGLAHRRLSIIDIGQGGHQPKLSDDGRCAITFNGEIYNYIELREELRAAGFVFHTNSDTEVLLNAYRAWGTDCLPRLNGMFAFALWDHDKQELFVARDRFGEKPLYVTRVGRNGWAFASEMKALLAHPAVDDTLNHEYLVRFLGGTPPLADETTPFAAIRRLAPATALRLAADGRELAQWRHWTPTFAPSLRGTPRAKLAERFSELLDHSLKLRLRSDVGIAATLSGGLDSSVLVAAMAASGNSTFVRQTFSARFDDMPAISEGEYIDLMNQRLGLDGHGVTPQPDRLADECMKLHWHQELPFGSTSMYLEWSVMRLARENGVKVLVNGQGPDELLGGYQTYFPYYQFDMAARRKLLTLVRNTWAMARRLEAARKRYGNAESRVPVDVMATMKDAVRAAFSGQKRDFPRREGVPSSDGGNTFRHLIADGTLYTALPEQLHSADANSMAFGIESRCPFLDNDLVDFCTQLPEEALIHDGWQKHIMRLAGHPSLPDEVRWRADKIGFAGPQIQWLKQGVPDWVEANLADSLVSDVLGQDNATVLADWEAIKQGRSTTSWRVWRWISVHHLLRLAREGNWRNGLDAATTARDAVNV